jgi:hypothetical protein
LKLFDRFMRKTDPKTEALEDIELPYHEDKMFMKYKCENPEKHKAFWVKCRE